MVKYEEKFFIINKKHLRDIPREKMEAFSAALKEIQPYISDNKYYVCNQDEPYAEDVLKLILFDEMKKQLEKPKRYEGYLK